MGLCGRLEARPSGLHMGARAVHQLTAGGLAAAQRLGHFGVVGIEDLAQQKGCALLGRQLLQHEQQRRGDIMGLLQQLLGRGSGLGPGLDQRLGQPETRIVLALHAQAPQPVYGQPRGRGHQPGLGLGNRGALAVLPAQPDILHQILGLGALAQHAIGQPEQARAMALEILQSRIGGRRSVGSGAHVMSPANRPGQPPSVTGTKP